MPLSRDGDGGAGPWGQRVWCWRQPPPPPPPPPPPGSDTATRRAASSPLRHTARRQLATPPRGFLGRHTSRSHFQSIGSLFNMAGTWSRPWFVCVCCFLLLLVVSASVTEQVLQAPLLQVGQLWLEAASTVYGRVLVCVTTVPDLYHWKTYVYLVVLLTTLVAAYRILIKPLNRVRKLGDTGYIPEGSFSARETANYVQRRRNVGTVPPVYPNGWFGIMESFSLNHGQATTISVLGASVCVSLSLCLSLSLSLSPLLSLSFTHPFIRDRSHIRLLTTYIVFV